MPQWSPVMKTGNTKLARKLDEVISRPQWSPVMKTGNTVSASKGAPTWAVPQWSPVMKTGNTSIRFPIRPLKKCLNGARS